MMAVSLFAGMFLVRLFPFAGQNIEGPAEGRSPMVINEVMASNGSTIPDGDGDYEDWIELYNPGDKDVDLKGYFLSDDPGDIRRWRFPGGVIRAGGHLLVWASGKNKKGMDGELHTNFRINRKGEPIILVKPDGQTIADFMEPLPIPRDMSYGRQPDGSPNWFYFEGENVSPGESNNNKNRHIFPDPDLNPVFSHEPGFYSEGFSLKLETKDPGARIYFTLDGSEPCPDNRESFFSIEPEFGILEKRAKRIFSYKQPIRVDSYGSHRLTKIPSSCDRYSTPEQLVPRAFIIKAAAYKENGRSETVSGTYFIGQHEHLHPGIPILSMIVDEEDFFGYEQGIYVPGKFYDQKAEEPRFTGNYFEALGSGWERNAYIEYFDPRGNLEFSRSLGVRIHGGTSRVYSNKSLRLYARNGPINYPLFGDSSVDEYSRLKLRVSGQDQTSTFFRDALMTHLFEETSLDIERYRPVLLFINGEYWGITNLRERFDEYFLERHYGVDPDEVLLLKTWDTQETGLHDKALEFIRDKNLDEKGNLDRLGKKIDLLSYIDLKIASIFFGRWDQGHYAFWKESLSRGKWKWYLWDMDIGMGLWPRYAPEGIESWEWNFFPLTTTQYTGYRQPNYILVRLLDSTAGRNLLISRFADLMNTTLSPDHVLEKIDEFQSRLEPAMPRHIERWRPPSGIESLERWHENVEELREYARNRAHHQRLHIVEHFNLEGIVALNLKSDPGMGQVRVNTINIAENTPGVAHPHDWSGIYFQGVPVEIEAVPAPGHDFAGWIGLPAGSGRKTIQTFYKDEAEIKAVFRKVGK